jgi:hypothetical protein
LQQFHLSLSFLTERFNLSSYLFVEWVGAKLHWTGDDSLGRDGVEDRPRLEDYQPGDVSHDLAFLELLQVQDLKENQSQMKLSHFNHPLKSIFQMNVSIKCLTSVSLNTISLK